MTVFVLIREDQNEHGYIDTSITGVFREARTAKEMGKGATLILETLKSVADTGRPKLSTRVMYALFGKLGFVLPKRTRAEHWPLPATERAK